jgi:hypothetical protein
MCVILLQAATHYISSLLDERVHLLGVAFGKTNIVAANQNIGTQMEDMNIGNKCGDDLAFPGKTAANESTPLELSLENLYQQMLPRTVLIVLQK